MSGNSSAELAITKGETSQCRSTGSASERRGAAASGRSQRTVQPDAESFSPPQSSTTRVRSRRHGGLTDARKRLVTMS